MAKEKSRIPHMLLDTDFFAKPKTLRLTQKFGAVGPTAILLICCKLINADDGKMCREDVGALSFLVGCDLEKWTEIVNYLIEIGWLKESDGFIWSDRTIEDREKVLSVRETWALNGKKGGRPTKNQTETQINPSITQSKPNDNQSATQSTDTDTKTETDTGSEKDLNPKEAVSPKKPDPLEPFLIEAQKYICEPTGKEPWENDNQYIGAGRRPLKKFPKVFLSGHELAQVFQQYDAADIPRDNWKEAFQLVDAKLKLGNGFNNSTCAFSWLIGWVKNQLLESVIKTTKLKNVRSYANAARN